MCWYTNQGTAGPLGSGEWGEALNLQKKLVESLTKQDYRGS